MFNNSFSYTRLYVFRLLLSYFETRVWIGGCVEAGEEVHDGKGSIVLHRWRIIRRAFHSISVSALRCGHLYRVHQVCGDGDGKTY